MKKLCGVLIFILLFSIVFFSLTACNLVNKDKKGDVYTQEIVNEEQWNRFFVNSLSSTRYCVYETLSTTNSTNPIISYSANYIYDSIKFYSYTSQIAKYSEDSNIFYENYQSYSFVDGQYYEKYTSNVAPDSDDIIWSPFSRYCINEQVAQEMFISETNYLSKLLRRSLVGDLSQKFADFSFDNKNNVYIAKFTTETITIDYCIAFENGKISKINYIQSVSSNNNSVYGGIYEYNVLVSYD